MQENKRFKEDWQGRDLAQVKGNSMITLVVVGLGFLLLLAGVFKILLGLVVSM